MATAQPMVIKCEAFTSATPLVLQSEDHLRQIGTSFLAKALLMLAILASTEVEVCFTAALALTYRWGYQHNHSE